MARPTELTAAENLRRRKNRRFSIGCEWARPRAVRAARTARPPMPAPITRGEDQPRTGASISDHSTRPRPAMDISAPATSGASAAGFFDSGISGSAHAMPRAAIGTLIRNTDPHQKPGQQQATDHRAERDAQAGGTGPDADRALPFRRVAGHG